MQIYKYISCTILACFISGKVYHGDAGCPRPPPRLQGKTLFFLMHSPQSRKTLLNSSTNTDNENGDEPKLFQFHTTDGTVYIYIHYMKLSRRIIIAII